MAQRKCRACKGRGWAYRLTVVNPFGVCRVLDDGGKEVKDPCGTCHGGGLTLTDGDDDG